jgi:RNA polymerase sigma-70 factor (ECF subfamily)
MKLENLYNDYLTDVYRYSMFRLHSREEAEDVTSETFLRVANDLNQNIENWRLWLIGIARNVIREKYRKDSKSAPLDDEVIDMKEDDSDIAQIELDAETIEMIKQKLDELDDDTREVIILKIWEEMNFAQIAQVTETKESTVKLRYYRGLEKIKLAMGERKKSKKLYAFTLPILVLAIGQIKVDAAYMPSQAFLSKFLSKENMFAKLKAIKPAYWIAAGVGVLVLGVVAVVMLLSLSSAAMNQAQNNSSSSSSTTTTVSSTTSSTSSAPTFACAANETVYENTEYGFKSCVPAGESLTYKVNAPTAAMQNTGNFCITANGQPFCLVSIPLAKVATSAPAGMVFNKQNVMYKFAVPTVADQTEFSTTCAQLNAANCALAKKLVTFVQNFTTFSSKTFTSAACDLSVDLPLQADYTPTSAFNADGTLNQKKFDKTAAAYWVFEEPKYNGDDSSRVTISYTPAGLTSYPCGSGCVGETRIDIACKNSSQTQAAYITEFKNQMLNGASGVKLTNESDTKIGNITAHAMKFENVPETSGIYNLFANGKMRYNIYYYGDYSGLQAVLDSLKFGL